MSIFCITGANRGIGLALTERYLAAGHTVVATYRSEDRASALRELGKTHGDSLKLFRCDVTSESDIKKLASDAGAAVSRIDYLINNAGVIDRGDESVLRTSTDVMTRTWVTNTLAPVLVIRELLELVQRSREPRIVNVSSKMGSLGEEQPVGSYSYKMSKAALNMLGVNLARELAERDVIVVSVHPGWVRTEMGGDNAAISVDESADGLVKVIDGLTREHTGKLLRYDGVELPY